MRRFLALVVGLLVGLMIWSPVAHGRAYGYDAPTVARVDGHQVATTEAGQPQFSGAWEQSAFISVAARGTSTTPTARSVATNTATSASEAADLVRGANPVGSALKSDAAHRSASFVVDDIASNGTVFRTVGSDGVTRTLVQSPGELNGVVGRFEWIIDDAGSLTHQMFVKGGSINGAPIKP